LLTGLTLLLRLILCYAIINALQFIFCLDFNNILIISDNQSVLLAISSGSFYSVVFSLVLIIKSLVYPLYLENNIVNFFRVPSHVGIVGNRRADHLANSFTFYNQFSTIKIPNSNFYSIYYKLL